MTLIDPLRLDADRLGAYLERTLSGFHGLSDIEKFAGGQSNPTYLLRADSGRYVLRKKPPGELLRGAHQVEREHRIISALSAVDFPVPKPKLLCEDSGIVGTPFYVMEFTEGRILRDTALPGLPPSERRAIYVTMAETLARLHEVDWRSAGLDTFGKQEGYLARQVDLWTRQYAAAKTDEIPAMDRVATWLSDNVPDDSRVTIVHGDFRLENLVFHPSEARVIAVLDWELSTLGHPMTDLAYNCMPYHLPSWMKALGGVGDLDLSELGIPSEREYVALYAEATDATPSDNWQFFMVLSLFRSAAILQGVYKRALSANASSSDALEVGRLACPVAEQALALTA